MRYFVLLVLVGCGGVVATQGAELSPALGGRPLFSLYWNSQVPVCGSTRADGGCAFQVEIAAVCATVDVPVPVGCLDRLDAVYADAGCVVADGGSSVVCSGLAPLTNGCDWLPLDAPTAAVPNPLAVCN